MWLPDDEERWRAYPDTDDVLVFYCPECAEREFGGRSLNPAESGRAPASLRAARCVALFLGSPLLTVVGALSAIPRHRQAERATFAGVRKSSRGRQPRARGELHTRAQGFSVVPQALPRGTAKLTA